MPGTSRRPLGSQGLVTSGLGLGCMGMSGIYGAADEIEAVATIRRALDLGVSLIDTADIYAPPNPFTNEFLVGRAIAGRRDEVTVASKFGFMSWPTEAGGGRYLCGERDYVHRACDASLKRLAIDHIDLYYCHRIDPLVPVEETVGAMGELVAAGKVRYIGLCEVPPDVIRRAHAAHPLTALQSEYSLWMRDHEADVLPTVRELGIGFVAYCPLGRGFLTGRAAPVEELADADIRRQMPRFQPEHRDSNLALVQQLEEIGERLGATAAQVALAWLLTRDVVPIPGTKRVRYLEENAAAAGLILDEQTLALLDDEFATSGNRYPAAS